MFKPTVWPNEPFIQWVPGGSFRRSKAARGEVDLSLVSSIEVENEWRCTSTPLYAFVAWTGPALLLQLSRPYLYIMLVYVVLLILAAGSYVLYLNLPILLVEHLTSS